MKGLLAYIGLLLAFSANSAVAQNTYTAYINSDNSAATGCTITLPGGTLAGADLRIQATLTPGAVPTVTGVTAAQCSGGTFGAGTSIGGGSVDLNTGVSGSDSVEFSVPGTGILTGGGQTLAFGFTAQSPTGSDVMFTGSNGGPIIFGITVPTPALGVGALALLALLVIGVAHRFGRTRWYRRVVALSMVAMCGVALAAAFNWTGIAPVATDPAGDPTNGSPDIDLRAGFVAVDANTIYFRIDVTDLQTQAPQITSANATTFIVGQAGTFVVTSIGVPSAALTLSGCTLPTGVTFVDNGNGTGTLAGTPGPGTANTYACTLTAANGIPPDATQTFTLTVANAPSQTALAVDINPSVYAQSVTFTATVTPAPPGSGTPTGTVNFLDGATSIGSGTLNGSGVATFATSTLSVATHPITAQYAGDMNFGPSTSSIVNQVVNQASQTITFTSTAPAGAAVGGPTYMVTATASSGLAVALTIDASATSVCSLAGSTVSFIGVGTCVIDANQAGDANYTAAAQVQQSFAVGKGSQTITFTSTAPAGAAVGGPTYTVTATASSGLPVTLTIDASSASVCSLSGSMVSFIGAGTCAIDANQAGNANYNVAPQAQQSFAVGKGSQTITFTSTAPANAVVAGPTYTVTASASSGLPVTLTIDVSSASVCSLSGSTVSFTASGTCVIDANQAGDASYSVATQVQQSFAVSKNNQTITFASTAPGGAVVAGPTYTVTATASSGLPVAFTIDASASSVCSISGSTVSFIGVGTCVIDANQAGDANYNAAPQAQQSFAVGKGLQTISFSSTAPGGVAVGGPTYTVAASATSGLPVAFTIDASAAAVCSIAGTTVSFIGAGTCVIDANQAGNANYNAAPQVQQSFAVVKGNQTISFTSTAPTGAQFNGPTYTVTATATSGLPVTLTIDASSASVCSLSGSTVSFIGAGTCVIDANQAGDANYNAAPQVQQSFAVAKVNQTISFTSTAPTNAVPGIGSYTVTATATSGLAVTFTIDASATSVCSIIGSTVSFVADGTCVIDANQAGNANYNAASQVQQSFVVDTPPTVTSTSPANGATNVPLASTISITFSKLVNTTGATFGLACTPGTAPSFAVTPASPATTYVLHPTANLPFDSSCTVTVTASTVTDVSAGRNMTADYSFSFATPPVAKSDTYPETLVGNISADSSVISFSVLTNDQFNLPVTITAFDATSANGGMVSMNTSTGQFTYNPAAGYTGADSFTYAISNAHGSSTGTLSLTVTGIIWFIDNTAGAGDGRLSSPFNTLAAFQAVNDGVGNHPAANGNIFIYDSATGYTGPTTLLNGQKLIGQDATSSLSAISGLTPGTSQAALPATGGGSPNKVSIAATGNAVTLGSGNTVSGMTLGNATGTAMTGSAVGTFLMSDLAVNNSSGAGISLTGGGPVTASGTNTITTTTGTALNVANTTIGASGLTFRSISAGTAASGPVNGIVLNNTGSNGGLTVTGTGSAASGGVIQKASGNGVELISTKAPSLSWMTITNNTGSGIRGDLVNGGLALSNLSVTNNSTKTSNCATPSDTVNCQADIFLYNLLGTGNTISNSTVSGGFEDNLHIESDGSNVLGGLAISGSTIADNSSTTGNDGLQIISRVNAKMTVTANSNTFHGNRATSIMANAGDASIINVTLTNNAIYNAGGANQGNIGIDVNGAVTSSLTFNVSGNTIGKNGATLAPLMNHGINVFFNSAVSGGSVTGNVSNNVIHNAGYGFAGFGIRLFPANGNSVWKVRVDGNTVDNVGQDYGIFVGAGEQSVTGADVVQAGVMNNNVSVLGVNGADPGALDAIRVQARVNGSMCARISGNTATPGSATGFFGIYTRQANAATYNLEGGTGGVAGSNPGTSSIGTVGTINNVAAGFCSQIP